MNKMSVFPMLVSVIPLSLVYFFSASAEPESEEGALCDGARLCGLGPHCTSLKKTQQKKEAGSREGSAQDGGHSRAAATLSKTHITEKR